MYNQLNLQLGIGPQAWQPSAERPCPSELKHYTFHECPVPHDRFDSHETWKFWAAAKYSWNAPDQCLLTLPICEVPSLPVTLKSMSPQHGQLHAQQGPSTAATSSWSAVYRPMRGCQPVFLEWVTFRSRVIKSGSEHWLMPSVSDHSAHRCLHYDFMCAAVHASTPAAAHSTTLELTFKTNHLL